MWFLEHQSYLMFTGVGGEWDFDYENKYGNAKSKFYTSFTLFTHHPDSLDEFTVLKETSHEDTGW